jgi:hypothetical protein
MTTKQINFINKYRIMEKNGVYKIEEWKRSGLFRRYRWTQLTKSVYFPPYHVRTQPIFYFTKAEAMDVYNDLCEEYKKEKAQWTQIHP